MSVIRTDRQPGRIQRVFNIDSGSELWSFEAGDVDWPVGDKFIYCSKCSGEMHIISFIDLGAVIIHSKRNSLAHELSPGQDAIKASFNCVLAPIRPVGDLLRIK